MEAKEAACVQVQAAEGRSPCCNPSEHPPVVPPAGMRRECHPWSAPIPSCGERPAPGGGGGPGLGREGCHREEPGGEQSSERLKTTSAPEWVAVAGRAVVKAAGPGSSHGWRLAWCCAADADCMRCPALSCGQPPPQPHPKPNPNPTATTPTSPALPRTPLQGESPASAV